MARRIVMACDGGANTGIVVLALDGSSYPELLGYHTVKTSPKDRPVTRYEQIFGAVTFAIRRFCPEAMATEQPLSWLRNGVPLLWMLVGASMGAAMAEGCPLHVIGAPTRHKRGRKWILTGLKTKEKARKECERYFGKKIAKDMGEHCCDAVMMAIWCFSQLPPEEKK